MSNRNPVYHPRLFVHLPYEDFPQYSALLAAHRQQPELYISAAVLDGGVAAIAAESVGAQLRELGMSCTVHAPYHDMAPGSPDPQFRTVTRQRLQGTLAMAVQLGCRVMVAHAGFDTRRHGYMISEWLTRAVNTWLPLGDLAAKHNILLALENVYEYGPEPVVELVSRLNHPWIGGCFDVGHVACFSRTPMTAWLAAFGPYIRHLHLHDNLGEHDDHWGLGRGMADLARVGEFLETVQPPPTLTIEGHGLEHVLASVAYIEQHGWLRS